MARQRHEIRTHLTRLRGFSITFFSFVVTKNWAIGIELQIRQEPNIIGLQSRGPISIYPLDRALQNFNHFSFFQ